LLIDSTGVRIYDEDIMRHTRHRDLRTMRGSVRRAGLVNDSPAGMILRLKATMGHESMQNRGIHRPASVVTSCSSLPAGSRNDAARDCMTR